MALINLTARSDGASIVYGVFPPGFDELSGTSQGSGSVIASLSVLKRLTGSISAASTVASRLGKSFHMETRSAGTSTVSAQALKRTRGLMGSNSSSSLVSSNFLRADKALTTSSAGVATARAGLRVSAPSLVDTYLEVTGAPILHDAPDPSIGKPGTYVVPVTVRRGGKANVRIPGGAGLVKWGENTGLAGIYTGGILLTSDQANSPYMDIFTVDSTDPWLDGAKMPRVRLGNLNGILGLSSDQWGLAAGTDLGDNTKPYIKASDQGVLLSNVDLSVIDGSVYFGDVAETNYLKWQSGVLEAKGSIKADAGYLGDLDISGVLSIGTGGGIYQGTGSFATPTTGLKVWNDGGVGRIAGFNTGTEQWSAGTDGKLYAGGGKVMLDLYGVTLQGTSGTVGSGSIRLSAPDDIDRIVTVFGQIYNGSGIDQADLSVGWDSRTDTAHNKVLHLSAQADGTGGDAGIGGVAEVNLSALNGSGLPVWSALGLHASDVYEQCRAYLISYDVQLSGEKVSVGAPVNHELQLSHPAAMASRVLEYGRNNRMFTRNPNGPIYPMGTRDLLTPLQRFNIIGAGWTGHAIRLTGSVLKMADYIAGHHMTPSAGCTVGTDVNGVLSYKALYQLDGTAGYLAYATTTDVMDNTNFWHFGGWFRVDQGARNNGLFSFGSTTRGSGAYLDSSNRVIFAWYDTTGAFHTYMPGVTCGTGWHFVAFLGYRQSAGSYYVRMFVDGTWQNLYGVDPVNFRQGVGEFRIGEWAGYFLKGMVGAGWAAGWSDTSTIPEFYEYTKPEYI